MFNFRLSIRRNSGYFIMFLFSKYRTNLSRFFYNMHQSFLMMMNINYFTQIYMKNFKQCLKVNLPSFVIVKILEWMSMYSMITVSILATSKCFLNIDSIEV